MVIQVLNLSSQDIFKKYSNEYNIFRDVYSIGLFGLEIRNIEPKFATIVQHIVLQEKEICYKKNNNNVIDLLITGSFNLFKLLARRIVTHGDEDLGYRIVNVLKNYEEYGYQSYKLGNKSLKFSLPRVMGILNVTPDSFSDGGKYFSFNEAVKHAMQMSEDGADIIDIGGESTRPGSENVPESEELKRTIPVIKEVKKLNKQIVLSIDTTKGEVARQALDNGAEMVNDISGLTFSKSMVSIVKEFDAGVIVMHIQGTPETMQDNPFYDDIITEVYDFLYEQSNFALRNGIKKIIVDPGIGFGKRVEDNFELLRRLVDFRSLGFPIMIGLSKKSFIGKTLNLDTDKREIPGAILESISALNSARIIRTHNVKSAVQTTKLLKYFIRG